MTEPRVPRLTVDIVSDVMCPWCIIGWLKFQSVMAHFEGRLDFRVQWHPFELNPDMPPEGEDAADQSIFIMSALVGALLLSRSVQCPELAQRLLDVTRELLKDHKG